MKKKILWFVLAILTIFIFRFVQYIYYMNKAVFGEALYPYFGIELLSNLKCGIEVDPDKINYRLIYYNKAEKIYKEPFLYYTAISDYVVLNDWDSVEEAAKKVFQYIDNYPLFEKTLVLATSGSYPIFGKDEYKTQAAYYLLTCAQRTKNYDLCIEASDYLLPSAYYDKAVCEYNLAKNSEALNDFKAARKYEIKKLKEYAQSSSSPVGLQNRKKRIEIINAYIKMLS